MVPTGTHSHLRRQRRRGWLLAVACILLICACATAPSTSAPHSASPGAPTAAMSPVATAGAIPTAAAPAPAASPAAGPVPRFEPARCPFALPPSETEGTTVSCGYLVVPERHARPDGPAIRLAVARFASRQRPPAPDPVIYLSGGPGGPVQRLVSNFTRSALWPLATTREVIIFDQRGAGHSQPSLDCPEVREQLVQDAAQPLTPRQEVDRGLAALGRCRERLVAQGVDLAAYTTAENAADVEALRVALGYPQVNLLGVSYGTLLALTVLRDHPAGVRSVVLDSVLPPQRAFRQDDVAAHYDRALRLAFASCAAQGACPQGDAALEDAFAAAVAQLDARPRTVRVPDSRGQPHAVVVTGARLVEWLRDWLYIPATSVYVPTLIEELARGEDVILQQLVRGTFFERVLPQVSLGMHSSVVCAEAVESGSQPPATATADLLAPIRDHTAAGVGLDARKCDAWAVPRADARAREPVASDRPTLLLAGGRDPITPPAYAQLAAQTLPRGVYVEMPGLGHGVTGSDCGAGLAVRFVAEPTARPDTSCTAGVGVRLTPRR